MDKLKAFGEITQLIHWKFDEDQEKEQGSKRGNSNGRRARSNRRKQSVENITVDQSGPPDTLDEAIGLSKKLTTSPKASQIEKNFSPIPESKVENQITEAVEIQQAKFSLQDYDEPTIPPNITDDEQEIQKKFIPSHKQLSVVMEKGGSQMVGQEDEIENPEKNLDPITDQS